MLGEGDLPNDDIKAPLPEVTILRDIVSLLWEKTQNLERIQNTYEDELGSLTAQVSHQSNTIDQLTEQLRRVGRGDGCVEEDGGVPGLSVTSCSDTSDGLVSPGLSSNIFQGFTGTLSGSSFSEDKRSASYNSFEIHEAEEALRSERKEALRTIPPILVTTLSYETSVYNGSISPVNSSDMEDVFHGADVIASPCHSNLSNITLTDAEEMRSTTSVKSEKTRDVVSKMMVNKIPIVLKEASVDSTDDEERDEFIVTPLKRKPKTLKDDMPSNNDENLANFNWTRSDTFDVIPISQSSLISVPVKPKRGVNTPLHTQRHPTERDDTVTSRQVVCQKAQTHITVTNGSFSEHSTFSQESCSSRDGSICDYEVQYITPQLSDPGESSLGDEEERSSGRSWSGADGRSNFKFDEINLSQPESANTKDWSDTGEDVLTPQ